MTLVEDRQTTSASQTARKAMIDSQLRVSGINADAVLARMGSVAREDYVPETARGHAYMDRAIPLANGRKMPSPLVQGKILEEAAAVQADKALLVESGSGYLAEILRPLVGELEVISPEEAVAQTRKRGDFTLLIIEGAVEEIPAGLAKRLGNDARIVTGLLTNGITRLATGRKFGDDISLLPLAEIGIPVFPEFNQPKGWSF